MIYLDIILMTEYFMILNLLLPICPSLTNSLVYCAGQIEVVIYSFMNLFLSSREAGPPERKNYDTSFILSFLPE